MLFSDSLPQPVAAAIKSSQAETQKEEGGGFGDWGDNLGAILLTLDALDMRTGIERLGIGLVEVFRINTIGTYPPNFYRVFIKPIRLITPHKTKVKVR